MQEVMPKQTQENLQPALDHANASYWPALLITVSTFLTVSLAAGYLMEGENHHLDASHPTPTPSFYQPGPLPSLEDTVKPYGYAKWHLYIDTQHNFQVSYPPDYGLEPIIASVQTGILLSPIQNAAQSYEPCQIAIYPPDQSAADDPKYGYWKQSITINGIRAIRVHAVTVEEIFESIIFRQPDFLFILELTSHSDIGKCEQIFSTFHRLSRS
jgi:hypothetical protein